LAPIAAVIAWLWLNPRIFAPVEKPTSWSAKGIYGEKLWLMKRERIPAGHRAVQRLLMGIGGVGLGALAFAVVMLEVWPTVFGASLIVVGQLWSIDRFGLLFDEQNSDNPSH